MPADTPRKKDPKGNAKQIEATKEAVAEIVKPKSDNPPNPDIVAALEMCMSMAQDGHIQALALAFALGPEHSGKVMVNGGMHQTLAGTCLCMANQLSREPFDIATALEKSKQEEARSKPELVT